MIGNNKGVKFYDRELGGKVRTLTLEQIYKVLMGEMYAHDTAFKKQLLLKLAGNILPRLNEHTGAEGEALFPKPIMELSNVSKNNSNKEGNKPNETS